MLPAATVNNPKTRVRDRGVTRVPCRCSPRRSSPNPAVPKIRFTAGRPVFRGMQRRPGTRQNAVVTDIHTREVRSANMAAVRNRDTKPELAVRRLLHGMGYRFRLHNRELPGTPDLVLARHRVVVFVHGCFWHKHECRAGRSTPKTRAEFWEAKRNANVARDERHMAALMSSNWRVLVVWECWTGDLPNLAGRLATFMKGNV